MKDNEKNRIAWNESMFYHRKGRKESIKEMILNDNVFNNVEIDLFSTLDLSGKKICQLCCNNGRELVSLFREYKCSYCLGVDISDEAIKDANRLKDDFKVNIDFIRSDVLELSDKYNGEFDFVYITVGTLNWINDLENFFSVVKHLLKDNGKLIMYELHPLARIFVPYTEMNDKVKKDDFIQNKYFNREKDVYYSGIDYVGKKKYKSTEIIEYNYTLSDVINALLKYNFKLLLFNEFSEDISASYEHIEKEYNVPLSMLVLAENICTKKSCDK